MITVFVEEMRRGRVAMVEEDQEVDAHKVPLQGTTLCVQHTLEEISVAYLRSTPRIFVTAGKASHSFNFF